MDPLALSFPAAAVLNCELLQRCQSRTVTEMTPLSPCATFSSLEVKAKRGPLKKSAPCAWFFPRPLFLFASLLRPRSDCKQLKHRGNWKNGWTFSLAENRGGGVSWRQDSVCVWGGGEQVERGGREFRVGWGVEG